MWHICTVLKNRIHQTEETRPKMDYSLKFITLKLYKIFKNYAKFCTWYSLTHISLELKTISNLYELLFYTYREGHVGNLHKNLKSISKFLCIIHLLVSYIPLLYLGLKHFKWYCISHDKMSIQNCKSKNICDPRFVR